MTTPIKRTIVERWYNGAHGSMRYWASEPAQGAPVLFIHGYGALIEHWRAIMRPVARKHTLYALDLYGFGQSAIPRVPPTRQLWADQVADLITARMDACPVIVGHSMGGMVAAQVAHDYPDLVRGLVLVDSTGLADPENSPSTLDNTMFSFIQAPLIGEALASIVGNEWGARQGLLAAYYRKERVTPELVALFSAPLRVRAAQTRILPSLVLFQFLSLMFMPGELTLPALLIWGAEDRSVPPALAAYFKRTILPQAEVVIIPQSGHCPFDETPDEFAQALLPWLSAI
ncbi:alpha/beta fold hydrolase [Candidatus Gracilibacteria bacterium]|nr:alpha/beta fold hydrolase [Candidatus Gracilibacteria bacterium]